MLQEIRERLDPELEQRQPEQPLSIQSRAKRKFCRAQPSFTLQLIHDKKAFMEMYTKLRIRDWAESEVD
jgi:hypothetical protein